MTNKISNEAKIIKKTYNIKAPVEKVWQALVNVNDINGWGGGPAKMSDEVNAKFSFWGGDIYGKNLEVSPEKKLVQEWFGGDWEKPSILEINLMEKNGLTEIKLTHKDVPDGDVSDIADAWDAYYFGPMKEYLEKK